MPEWQDCSWIRKVCGQDSCPICSRIKQNRESHVAKGEDPDSMEAVFHDVGENLKEVLRIIKDDAHSKGFEIDNIDDIKEPPEPEIYPLYHKIKSWRDSIYALADESDETSSSWLYTQAGEDLLWYANTLLVKSTRQLNNSWHIAEDDSYGEFDYEYTGWVIQECLHYLFKALDDLKDMDIEQKKQFQIAQIMLESLESEIVNI